MANDEIYKNSIGLGEPKSSNMPHVLKPSTSSQGVGDNPTDYSRTAKRSGKSAGHVEGPNPTFDELYGPKRFTRFFSIKSKLNSDLTKLNMFKVDKYLRQRIGKFERLSENYTDKSWTVEVLTDTQGINLQTMTNLLSEPIIVTPHEFHNKSQGVITCRVLRECSNEEITEGLSEHGVIECRRIVRKPKSPSPEPTDTLILTFNSSELPNRITIRTGLMERVRLYIPLPRRCYKCQKYGHSGMKCRKEIPVCVRCGEDMEEGHSPNNCQLPIRCCHCNEGHQVSSRSCPKYIFEKEVLEVKTREHLTFKEARDKVNSTSILQRNTYASRARNQRQRSTVIHTLDSQAHRNEDDLNNNSVIPESNSLTIEGHANKNYDNTSKYETGTIADDAETNEHTNRDTRQKRHADGKSTERVGSTPVKRPLQRQGTPSPGKSKKPKELRPEPRTYAKTRNQDTSCSQEIHTRQYGQQQKNTPQQGVKFKVKEQYNKVSKC